MVGERIASAVLAVAFMVDSLRLIAAEARLSVSSPPVEAVNHLVAPERVLQVSLIDALGAEILPWRDDDVLLSKLLDDVEFGLVLADLGRIGLARVAGLPGFAARCAEA